MGDYWQTFYNEAGVSRLAESIDDRPIFKMISSRFPMVGSKVAWSALTTHESTSVEAGNWAPRLLHFLAELGIGSEAAPELIHVGDSLSPTGLRFDWRHLGPICEILEQVPEHHYFVPTDLRWCLCIEMEDRMDYGEAEAAN